MTRALAMSSAPEEPHKRYWTTVDLPKSRALILGSAALLVVGVVAGGLLLVIVFFMLISGW